MPASTPGAARVAASAPPPSEAEPSAQTRKLARFLERLHQAGYFGKVTVSFQNGQITDVRTEQTRKLDEL